MAQLPAFCDNCGAVFPSGFAIRGEGAKTFVGNKSGPCPVCGRMGSVPDGVFDVTDNVIRLLSGPQKTVEQLRKLASVIKEARETVEKPNKAVEKIKNEAPELSSIVDALPKTRNELYGFLTIILMAVGSIIAVAALYKNDSPSEADIQNMIDNTIEQSFQKSEALETQRPQQKTQSVEKQQRGGVMDFKDKQFKNEKMRLDGNTFINCQFENCVIEYGGGPPPDMSGCRFTGVQWSFTEAALNTVQFMQALYHGMGEGGQQLIEQTFENIRKK